MKKRMLILLTFILLLPSGCKKEEIIKEEPVDAYQHINHYYYDQYSPKQKEIYNTIYQSFIDQKDTIELDNSIKRDDIERIYDQVLYDHPEIFYITYKKDYQENNLVIDYFYTKEEIEEYQKQLDAKRDIYLIQIQNKDLVEILDYTYDYMIRTIEYDHQAFMSDDFEMNRYYGDYNIQKALIDGKCVCAGYATTFQYLLNLAGYQCLLVQGSSSGGDHAWDALEIDGEFYYFDVTWDDNESGNPLSYYRYYGCNYEQMARNHFFKNGIFPTESTDYNYANMHGYVLKSLDDFSGLVEKQKGKDVIIIKCENETMYNELINAFNDHLYMEVNYTGKLPYSALNTLYLLTK